MDYFTADLHFCHPKLVEDRGFVTVEGMNDGILSSINDTCTTEDTLYVVGDISCNAKKHEHHQWIEAIQPKIILIKGNHDNREKNGKLSYHKYLHEFHHDLIGKFKDEEKVQLIHFYHFPLARWYCQNHGVWHIHGHLHGTDSMIPGKIMDVGWDIYKRPISFTEVKDYMDKQPTKANHHSGKFFE